MVGHSAKAFGRDVGRNTEGRRNHIDSYQYKSEDGSNRMRIRFNIKGSKGQIRVWAEVFHYYFILLKIFIILHHHHPFLISEFIGFRWNGFQRVCLCYCPGHENRANCYIY